MHTVFMPVNKPFISGKSSLVSAIKLHRNDILLQLPPETEQLTRTQASGLEVATLQSQTYNPVYGTIIKAWDNCHPELNRGGAFFQIDDKAFFQIFTFSTAKDRCYGDEMNPQFADEYIPVSHFAFKEGDYWYMIISASTLYFLLRSQWAFVKRKVDNITFHYLRFDEEGQCENTAANDTIIPLNNYVIASPVTFSAAEGPSALLEVDYSNKNYQINQAVILSAAEEWLKPGDHVFTLRHCDITIEEQYNNPVLGPDAFIIESQNIIAIMNLTTNNGQQATAYRAGLKRIIVRPHEPLNESPSGLISIEVDRKMPLTGTVISVGPGCATWKEGEIVLYARNSGMTIPHPEGDLLVLADIDIFASLGEEAV